ncbi:MAG: hypothetical protein ACRCZ4_04145 [Plesiomonas sp.]|uniref:hypothetical protein n=1 Tax=Plesiomonas sp. TaxID=2486279 RepID=UPI003EE43B47
MKIKSSKLLHTSIAVSLLALTSFSAMAKCDMHNAVRNEVLDKTLGISGKCTPQKVVKKEIDNTLGISDKKASLNETKNSINNTANHIKQQTNSVKNTYNNVADALEKE